MGTGPSNRSPFSWTSVLRFLGTQVSPWLALASGLMLVAQLAFAQEPSPHPTDVAEPASGDAGNDSQAGFSLPGSEKSEPVEIEAENLEFDARDNVAVFRGDVVTTQGDVTMRSAVLRVEFAQSNGTVGTLERPRSVVAEGSVSITQGARVARGNRAAFDETTRTLVLSGDSVLYEGSSQVRGERIIVYLDEDRTVVEGTRDRVKAILVPDAEPAQADEVPTGGSGPAVSDSPGATGSPADGAS